MPFNKSTFLYILFGVLAILIVGISCFTDGMFADGVIYATVSRNMALGHADIWVPQMTKVLAAEFVEHPTFSLWFQALFFKIMGDTLWAERAYTFFTFLVCSFFIHKIWGQFKPTSKDSSWIPLLIWLIIPTIHWAYANNLLENGQTMFTLASSWISLRAIQKNKYTYSILAGLLIFLGVLSKSPVGLFPLAIPTFYLLCFRDQSIKSTLIHSGITTIVLSLLFLLLFELPGPRENLSLYWDNQLLKSLQGNRETHGRLTLIGIFFNEMLVPFLLVALTIITAYIRKKTFKLAPSTKRYALFFLLIAISASAPLLLSPKQLKHYLIPAYPFYALSIAVIVSEHWTSAIQKTTQSFTKKATYTTLTLLIISISVLIYKLGDIARDKKVVSDLHHIAQYIPAHTVSSSSMTIRKNFGILAYLYRYEFISCTPNDFTKKYHLVLKSETPAEIEGFRLAPTPDLSFFAVYVKED